MKMLTCFRSLDHLCYLYHMIVILLRQRLFIAAMWSPARLLALVCDVYCGIAFSSVVSWARCGT